MVERATPETIAALEQAGLLVLFASDKFTDWDLPADDSEAADFVIASLQEDEILLRKESLVSGEGI